MKTKTLLFLLVMLSFTVFAQNKANPDEASIKKSLTYFMNSIKDKKIDQGVNCIYPKLFIVIPKDQMTQILNMTYNNPFMKIDMSNLKFGNIELPKQINGEYFSIVNYFFHLKCDVGSLNDEMKKRLNAAFISKYGKNNVKYIAAESSYFVNAHMRACAVSKNRKNWQFIILEKEYKPHLIRVLPKKVLDKI
ncbi:hypothetical protein [uncultured Chryseobacterium sp.]|uniref:hypothetical protein n=1 Tax=uncultured Chryseobacterium sp. TaxID=259322 RepID=UPI0025E315AB|nr:hypothetical protein [uncultured Chryseobacterium sp.]